MPRWTGSWNGCRIADAVVTQLGEYLLSKQAVVGSSPTNRFDPERLFPRVTRGKGKYASLVREHPEARFSRVGSFASVEETGCEMDTPRSLLFARAVCLSHLRCVLLGSTEAFCSLRDQ